MPTFDPQYLGYIAGCFTTLSFLPQAIHTIKTRETASLSLGMYSLFTVGVLCWLIYGIRLGDTAIIASNAVTLVLASCILLIKLSNTIQKKT
jgi:MtN3 and saliva related transmembrane protein